MTKWPNELVPSAEGTLDISGSLSPAAAQNPVVCQPTKPMISGEVQQLTDVNEPGDRLDVGETIDFVSEDMVVAQRWIQSSCLPSPSLGYRYGTWKHKMDRPRYCAQTPDRLRASQTSRHRLVR